MPHSTGKHCGTLFAAAHRMASIRLLCWLRCVSVVVVFLLQVSPSHASKHASICLIAGYSSDERNMRAAFLTWLPNDERIHFLMPCVYLVAGFP